MTYTTRTDGSDEAIVDYLISSHRAAIQATSQMPVEFVATTWRNWLSEIVDEGVLTVLDGLHGSVSRGDLRELAVRATGVQGRRQLFLAAMAWGRGKRNGRMLPGFKRAFAHPALDATLAKTCDLIRDGLPAEAYEAWRAAKIPGLGEAFFTKWFYVCGMARVPNYCLDPLVLDGRVCKSLRMLGWGSWRASGVRRCRGRAAAYCAYLKTLQTWATIMTIKGYRTTAEQLEIFLFHMNGAL
jgi:hypothetical protein